MSSEWMQVMLEEIARKRAEAAEARAEFEAREPAPAGARPGPPTETPPDP